MGNVWKAIKKHQAEEVVQTQRKREAPTDLPATAAAERTEAAVQPEQPFVVSADCKDYPAILMAHHDRGGRIAEQYRTLRTNLLARHSDAGFCTLITSAEVGEGKTLTAANLALVLAEFQDRRTLIVDGDLRKGRIDKLFRGQACPGIADLLRGAATLKEVVQPTAYSNLSFVSAGQADQQEVGRLVGQPELHEVVSEMRREYDYVLFDTPPVNSVSDAGIVGQAIGEALMVVRLNKTHRGSVDRAIRLLHAANVKIGGIVLTHQKYYIPGYLYRYS